MFTREKASFGMQSEAIWGKFYKNKQGDTFQSTSANALNISDIKQPLLIHIF